MIASVCDFEKSGASEDRVVSKQDQQGVELSPQYELELLRDDGEIALYRARQPANPISVLALVAGQAASRSIARLEHEFALAALLDPRWAAQPLELDRQNAPARLILHDNGGDPLDRFLGQPIELTRFLRLAINLAATVGQVHGHGLIHKDIKPANVLIDGNANVRLTGFGIATRLPRERQEPTPPEVIAGTFAYMAPEQTGRMNRSIDARSDLYSVGVTLYEMLTGSLPFTASDAMEWMHCHIARRPAPPTERVSAIPRPVEAIVIKLLAKTPEERYQTAAGVEADLKRCLTAWEAFGRIDSFPLGTQDASDRLIVPEKLYGREHEIDSLLAAFDRVVAHGTPELVLVSGYSGIGKSSVVNELHKVLVPPRGLFASGKFDQYKRDIPYATVAQAFQSLVRPLLGRSEAELNRWRDDLRDALGQNVQLIVNLVPELEMVIGTQPPVPDLPAQDAKNRFQMVFRRFLSVFARKEHPLALFLDDLQWLDTATLDLIEHLVTHSEVRYLLLVGAYRDNEVGLAHPLLRTLEAVRKSGVPAEKIVLAPLRLDDVDRLVADAMRCDLERARPLAQLVHEKTGGNPFFAIQFFTALAEAGLLAFDTDAAAWAWDIDRIRARNYTDNVVDLIAGKLKRFSATAQQAVKQLACLGHAADIATLILVHGETEEAIHAALWEAVHGGLVFNLDGTYKFLHDRIQQAAYSLIPEECRSELHLRLGRKLLASMTPDELAEHLFDVANQLNRGATLLVEPDEKAKVATINLRAGRKAKASAAFASACVYLAAGMALFGESDWGNQHELMFGLWLERAECEFLSGNFDVAEQLIQELLQRGTSQVDQAEAYRLKIQLHEVKAEYPHAVTSALMCLRLFDIDIPEHPTWEEVEAEYEAVWQILDGRPIESLIDLPLMTDPGLLAAMRLLSILLNAAYYTNFRLFCLCLCRLVNISMRHGTSAASTHAYGWLGNVVGAVFHRYREGYSLGRLACDLVEKHGFVAYQARVHLTMNMVVIWTQPIARALESNRMSFRSAIETGDLTYACYSLMHTIADLLVRNDPLDEVWRESERGLDFVRKARYRDIADTIVSQQRFIAAMQGRTATFSTFSDSQFDEAAFEAQLSGDRMTTMVCYYWITKLKARFLSGDCCEAFAAADEANALLWSVTGQIYLLDYLYYTALTVAVLFEDASTDRQIEWRNLLTSHCEQLREWAENYPPTFGDKYILVSAEIARLEGRDSDAMRLYEQAIQSAREHRFLQNEGVAHEAAAKFYLARGSKTAGHAHLEEARSCFAHWGADGKVQQLERSHPWLLEKPRPSPSTAIIDTAVSQVDAVTVIKASQAVSGEMRVDRLIETLMTIALEHAGAERGLLIVPRGSGYSIEAEAKTTTRSAVEVTLLQAGVTSAEMPETVLRTVVRTQQSVILYDALVQNPFSADEYVRQNHTRSVLCVPLVKLAKLSGVLYFENNLASHVFTPARISVLEHLASQAAISLENASLFAELRRTETYLAEAQRLSLTSSFGWSVRSGEVFWSEEGFRLFGYDRASKPTVDMALDRVHPDDVAFVRRIIARAARNKEAFDFENRLLMPDGMVKHVHVVARPVIDEPDNLKFIGALMDVTTRKQAHTELERSEQRYRHLFQDVPVALWQLDSKPLIALFDELRAQGVADLSRYIDNHTEFLQRAAELQIISEVNNSALQMFGASDRSELLGSPQWLLLESPDTFRRSIESRYRGEALFQETTRLAARDGQILDVLLTVACPGVAEDLGVTLMSMVDLTERMRAQEMLQRVQADFAHAARISMLGELTASIAHELVQPLAAITTNAMAGLRWLDRPAPDLAEARDTATRIISNARRAGDIVTRIRAMAVRRAPEQKLVSIDGLVLEALAFLRHEVDARGVTVLHDFAVDVPPVRADRIQLQQVIVNLAINAIQSISQAESRERKITIRLAKIDAATICCSVEDSGPGIDPVHLERIFDSFFTTKDSGMGMGLAICRSIIEAHGGRIAANNESVHGGACLYFTLPTTDAIS